MRTVWELGRARAWARAQLLRPQRSTRGRAGSEDLGWHGALRTCKVRAVSPYSLEQKSETASPERHFLEGGGKRLDSAGERLWLGDQAWQAPMQGEGHGGHRWTTHLPGSGIWRLPLLSTTSRGGRGCPAPTSTSWKVGMLKDTGGHGSGSTAWGAQPQGCYLWGTGAGTGTGV